MKTRLTATFILFALLACTAFIIFENRPSRKIDNFASEWVKNYQSGTGTFALSKANVPDNEMRDKILAEAKLTVQKHVRYTPGYFNIGFPMGDLPENQGVCTDLIIRSLRKAGYDLQQLINQDMTVNFSKYPNLWSLNEPDTNIDHRRIPNQITFFKKFGLTLPVEVNGNSEYWQAGDMVYWKLPSGSLHAGIISDSVNEKGIPKVIHILTTAAEEDVLTAWPIIAHFRYPNPEIRNHHKPVIQPSPSNPHAIPVTNSFAIDKANSSRNVSEKPAH